MILRDIFPRQGEANQGGGGENGFPPKFQDPYIPEVNIYIPSGVEAMESQAIYLDTVQDEVMDQHVYINIYIEASEVPASCPSDWYCVSKGAAPEFTYDKTVIQVYTGIPV